MSVYECFKDFKDPDRTDKYAPTFIYLYMYMYLFICIGHLHSQLNVTNKVPRQIALAIYKCGMWKCADKFTTVDMKITKINVRIYICIELFEFTKNYQYIIIWNFNYLLYEMFYLRIFFVLIKNFFVYIIYIKLICVEEINLNLCSKLI